MFGGIYIEFKIAKEEYNRKYNKELNKTGIFWAFSNEQFAQNKTHKNAPTNEYMSISAGGYFHKSNLNKVDKFFKVIAPELKKEFTSKIKIEDLIEYELINHECYYTGDYHEIVPIIQDYYSELSLEEITNKVTEVYKNTKDKNLDAFDMEI